MEKYFILFLFAIGAIIVVSYYVGNFLVWDAYKEEFKRLKKDLKYLDVNYDNYKLIQQEFEDIHRFSCKNTKKLEELKTAFVDRYIVLFEEETYEEHSPESIDKADLIKQIEINKLKTDIL